MHKNVTALIVVIALLGVAAYFYHAHNKKQERAAKHAAAKKDVDPHAFKVALVTPGAQDDKGWNENAKKALDRIKTELGADTATRAVSNGSSVEAHASFRNFAIDQKFNVVIGHAGEWNDARTREDAAQSPKTTFLISGSEQSAANVCGVRFLLEDATYVLGQIAATVSKSGVIGCVGPVKLPVIESTFYAFEEGAKAVKPGIKVKVVWTESFDDVVRAKEQTLQLINGENADVIFHNANNGAKGVFEAVQEQKGKGVLALGSNDDQAQTMPNYADVILASATLDIPSAYTQICKKIKDRTFKPETQFIGLDSGMVGIAYNAALESRIPAEAKKLADETVDKIKKGEFKVPRRELK